MVKITRVNEKQFAVETDTVLSDGTMRRDDHCELFGAALKSYDMRGFIRIGDNLSIQLGPKSLSIIQALAIGESVSL